MALPALMLDYVLRAAEDLGGGRLCSAGYPDLLVHRPQLESLFGPERAGRIPIREDSAEILRWHGVASVFEGVFEARSAFGEAGLEIEVPGIDAVGHRFLRYADPSAFGDVSEAERERFGGVLNQYYGFLDTLLGREIERLGPDDLLLAVSGFGMEPLSPGKRVLEVIAGNPQISGTHERAPDGFVLAFGPSVTASRPNRASVVDLAPTILYFLGLPVGRDMDGFARIDLFKPGFTSDKPVTYIPSYGR